jgi:hypothetical protein
VELECPVTSLMFVNSIPLNLALGAEYNLFLGRLRLTPRLSLGVGFDTTFADETQFAFTRWGGNAALEASYLVSRDVRIGIEGGYLLWLGTGTYEGPSYSGVFAGASVAFNY